MFVCVSYLEKLCNCCYELIEFVLEFDGLNCLMDGLGDVDVMVGVDFGDVVCGWVGFCG